MKIKMPTYYIVSNRKKVKLPNLSNNDLVNDFQIYERKHWWTIFSIHDEDQFVAQFECISFSNGILSIGRFALLERHIGKKKGEGVLKFFKSKIFQHKSIREVVFKLSKNNQDTERKPPLTDQQMADKRKNLFDRVCMTEVATYSENIKIYAYGKWTRN
jgi:hypothetical protein